MSKCKDCQYVWDNTAWNDIACCSLTRVVVRPDIEADCPVFNKDLSEYNICYNCKYYVGGGDWGLFCSHKDTYHHLGKFNDEACECFERKD